MSSLKTISRIPGILPKLTAAPFKLSNHEPVYFLDVWPISYNNDYKKTKALIEPIKENGFTQKADDIPQKLLVRQTTQMVKRFLLIP